MATFITRQFVTKILALRDWRPPNKHNCFVFICAKGHTKSIKFIKGSRGCVGNFVISFANSWLGSKVGGNRVISQRRRVSLGFNFVVVRYTSVRDRL